MRKNFIGTCLIAALLFVSSAFTSLAEFGPTIIDTTGPVTSAPSGDDAKAEALAKTLTAQITDQIILVVDHSLALYNKQADGSWQNDFLTRRNAEALKTCPDARAQLAYRKAMRNLRVRGLL